MILADNSPKPAHWYFIPPPDYDKKNRIMAFLPHVNAISNIFARIEKYRADENINSILVIHDVQDQYEEILEHTLESMKEIPQDSYPSWLKEMGLFHLPQEMKLEFDNSKTNIMLQVADIIAGITNRIWEDYRKDNNITEGFKKIFKEYLNKYPPLHDSIGVNFVVPHTQYYEFWELFDK